tara:strand:+ start:40 stop:711 length:672 start_codon:yes stop_codon:yes gene_type:complete
MIIQAKSGVFKGTQYRSRLEIYWAAFFDLFGIEQDYEPKRYKLNSGSYLPDFFLKNVSYAEWKFDSSQDCGKGLWFEVKNPQVCTTEGEFEPLYNDDCNSHKLMENLVHWTEKPGTIAWFTPSKQGRVYGVPVLTPHCETEHMDFQFWKCPTCRSITYARDFNILEYGVNCNCSNGSVYPQRKALEKEFYDYNSLLRGEAIDIAIRGNHIFYGSKHEVIGETA